MQVVYSKVYQVTRRPAAPPQFAALEITCKDFLVLELQTTRRKGNLGTLTSQGQAVRIPRVRRQIKVRASKYLKQRIRGNER